MQWLAPFYPWLKSFHIFGVVSWFAGMFYLPRLFVYHAAATDQISIERFKVMERRLFGMMSVGAALTFIFGIATLLAVPAFLKSGWMHAKLTLVVGLIVYNHWCGRLMMDFRNDRNRHSERWYRIFNEVPALFLLGIVILVVVKPF